MDNPRKKKEDSKRISKQPHEVAYQKRKGSKSSESKTDQRSDSGSARGSGEADRSGRKR